MVPLLRAEGGEKGPQARERRLLLSWAKAGKDSKESRETTRSEGEKGPLKGVGDRCQLTVAVSRYTRGEASA